MRSEPALESLLNRRLDLQKLFPANMRDESALPRRTSSTTHMHSIAKKGRRGAAKPGPPVLEVALLHLLGEH